MIIDTIENLTYYEAINNKLGNGLNKLTEVEINYDKRFTFDGGFLFFQTGTTSPMDEGTFEAHKKYIDVQIVLEGSEYVAWTPIDQLTNVTEYNSEKDVVRLNGEPETIMQIKKGIGYICLPHDGHKALKYIDEVTEYKKAVIKIEI